ncbi:MAG TPA: tetratricopeptide repeat protein [Polyangia bacterium]|nr:tetratricopeptide repeat protein [Polyangia bacterium]
MTRSMALVVSVAAAVAALPDRARAGDDDQAARAFFVRAEASFRAGRFGDALKDYQSAYQRKPLPGFLFDIGQCYRRVGLYQQARVFYRRFIKQNPPPAQRRVAQELIDDMDRLAAQRDVAEGPGADLSFSLPDATSAPAPMLAAVDSEPLPPRSLVVPARSLVVREAPRPVAETPAFYQRWWFWTLVGGAIAGGVATAIIIGNHQNPEGSLPPINAAGAGP